MKEMRIMRAIGDIDDEYIDEAAPVQAGRNAIRSVTWAKYAGIAACAALVLGIGVFAVKQNANIVSDPVQIGSDTSQPFSSSESSDFVQAVAPYEEFNNIEQAEKAVGFDIEIPDSYSDFSDRNISVMFGTMIEVQYRDTEGNLGLCIRKAGGTEDISGDHNTYDTTAEIAVGDYPVTIKGNKDKYFLAVWSFEGYSYSVSAEQGALEDELLEIIKKIQ